MICNNKTENKDLFESICLQSSENSTKGDINHNGDAVQVEDCDSDTECTTESKSENTVCDIDIAASMAPTSIKRCEVLKSVETSTETLTSDKVACR